MVILSHSLWQRRFGGDPAIIGQAITLSGASYIVIGVMPPGFHYPHGTDLPALLRFAAQTDVWAPVAFTPQQINLRSIFAVIALSLAAIGIYGVTSYAVTQRTREIGIRMALGAQRGSVMTLIIRQGMTVILIGISIGVITAAALARLMRGLLYGVGAGDPLTYIFVTVLLNRFSDDAVLSCSS